VPAAVSAPPGIRVILDPVRIDHGQCAIRREELSDILIFF
jgi:hypothetical protein